MIGFICGSPVYSYRGWTFEIHYWCGPCPVGEDGNPLNGGFDIPGDFWEVYCQFQEEEDKEQFNTYQGGCVAI